MSDKNNYSEKCPNCGKIGDFIPPSKTEGKKLTVTFKCPEGHIFTKKYDLK